MIVAAARVAYAPAIPAPTAPNAATTRPYRRAQHDADPDRCQRGRRPERDSRCRADPAAIGREDEEEDDAEERAPRHLRWRTRAGLSAPPAARRRRARRGLARSRRVEVVTVLPEGVMAPALAHGARDPLPRSPCGGWLAVFGSVQRPESHASLLCTYRKLLRPRSLAALRGRDRYRCKALDLAEEAHVSGWGCVPVPEGGERLLDTGRGSDRARALSKRRPDDLQRLLAPATAKAAPPRLGQGRLARRDLERRRPRATRREHARLPPRLASPLAGVPAGRAEQRPHRLPCAPSQKRLGLAAGRVCHVSHKLRLVGSVPSSTLASFIRRNPGASR